MDIGKDIERGKESFIYNSEIVFIFPLLPKSTSSDSTASTNTTLPPQISDNWNGEIYRAVFSLKYITWALTWFMCVVDMRC